MKTTADFQSDVVFPDSADKRRVDDPVLWGNEIKGSPFVRSGGGSKEFDKMQAEQPLLTEEIGQREQPGFRKSIRRARNGQAYSWERRDPADLHSWDPLPTEITNAFEEVFRDRLFDSDGRQRLRLVMHPHLKRVTMIEMHLDPAKGGEAWQTIWVCQHRPEKGHLPVDYRADKEMWHLTGRVGEFKWPELEELQDIERLDRVKYGVDSVEAFIHSFEMKEELETGRKMEDFTYGFLSYYFELAVDEANQEAGSGQKMRSLDTLCPPKSNPERWGREEKEGYTIVHKKQSLDGLRKRIDATAAERARLAENFSQYRSPKQLDKRREMILFAYREIAQEKTRENGKMRQLTKKEAAQFMRAKLGKVRVK